MNNKNDAMITIHARVEIAAATLQTIVENAKKIAGPGEKGVYRIDTAGAVDALISAFLREKGFDVYANDISNYKPLILQG